MSTLLRVALATKMYKGMTIDDINDVYGIDLRVIGKRPEPKHARQPWTQDMGTSMAAMWERGYSVSRIAAILGVRARPVQASARNHRHVCPARGGTPPWSDGRRAIIAEMWRDGKPIVEIAKAVDVKPTLLKAWAAHHRDICPARFSTRKKNTQNQNERSKHGLDP